MNKAVLIFFILLLCSVSFAQQDTMKTYKMEEIRVSSGELIQPKSVKILKSERIREMNVTDMSGIYKAVPSIKKQTNSRGETLFYLRGFGERHLSLYLDDVLLNIPWDYRIDLSLVPVLGLEKLTLTKGIPSVIYGPNNLGGVINAYTIENINGRKINLNLTGGSNNFKNLAMLFAEGNQDLSFVSALSYTKEGDYKLSKDFVTNEDNPGDYRKNSSKESVGGFGKLNWKVSERFRSEFTINFFSSEKNVPSEIGDPKPRYWKYPLWERFTIANNGKIFIGEEKKSMFIYSLAYTNFKMHIKQFKDNTYTTIGSEEFDHDKTFTARMVLNKFFNNEDNLKIGFNGLYTNHSEVILSENRTYSEYSEFLFNIGGEIEKNIGRFRFILGTGMDGLVTPELGNNPDKDPEYELSLNSSIIYEINNKTFAKLNYGKKTRYPSLREGYSEALGKFVINKNLKPETAKSIELALENNLASGNIDITLFYTHLKDGIAKTRLPSKKYIRINKDEIRNIGVELSGSLGFKSTSINYNFTYMKSRSKDIEGEFNDTLEYKPEIIFNSEVTHKFGNVIKLIGEFSFIGSEFAENPTGEGFVRLPDYFLTNIKVGKELKIFDKNADIFVRVDNVFDKLYYSQVNLPEPGRKFIIGFHLNL